MPHLVTALFEDPAQAGAALQALLEMGIAHDHITVIGLNEGREVSAISGFRQLSARDDRLAALQDLNLPGEDEQVFEQGLLSGYALIAARIDRDNMNRAVEVLGMFEAVNLDRGSQDWAKARPQGGRQEPTAPMGAGLTGGSTAGMTNTGTLPGMGSMTDATDDLGTADLRTDETAQSDKGLSSTTSAGQRREDGRAEREGVNELGVATRAPAPRTGPLQRALNRGGRVWAYSTDGS